MKIPPLLKITPKILNYISQIDALKIYFSSLNIPASTKNEIQRISYLKSSLYSARIEGNQIKFDEYESANKQKKTEIYNILSAIKYLENLSTVNLITSQIILKLHEKILNNKTNFRREMSAIYNQVGAVVYLPPPPTQISTLINQLIEYINTQTNFPLITALITHLIFEKIHPFLDGNGRTGRLLINAVLKCKSYNFGFIIPFEEYLDEHKNEYYYYPDIGLKQTEDYLIFMLNAILEQTKKIKEQIENEQNKNSQIHLPPRQQEMLQIIKDHNIVSFNFIKRRFLKIPERTLHYDLQKLIKNKQIIKIGKTKGVYYQIKI